MLKRISHKKSRKGCASCKKRHVKCDELGPPCTSCKTRGLDCVYNVIVNGSKSLKTRSESGAETSSAASPPEGALGAEERRLLELELMHRWSTSTYKSMCSIKEDERYIQVILPRKGFQHPFVMDSIIALTALQAASCPDEDDAFTITDEAGSRATSSTPASAVATASASASSPTTTVSPSTTTSSTATRTTTTTTANTTAATATAETHKYLRIALEYSERASASFRTNLSRITPDNISLLYICSGLVLVTNIAMPRCLEAHGYRLDGGGVLASVANMFDLLNGMLAIALANYDLLMASDYAPSVRAAIELGSADPDEWLPADEREALALLDVVNERNTLLQRAKGGGQPPEVDDDEVNLDATDRNPTHAEYKAIVEYLRVCFAEDARDAIRAFCLSLPSYSGPAFARGVAGRDPMALFVLLYWAVLVAAMARLKDAWWARGVGRRVVNEISGLLAGSELYTGLEEGRQAVAWARMQAGLGPELPGLGTDMEIG